MIDNAAQCSTRRAAAPPHRFVSITVESRTQRSPDGVPLTAREPTTRNTTLLTVQCFSHVTITISLCVKWNCSKLILLNKITRQYSNCFLLNSDYDFFVKQYILALYLATFLCGNVLYRTNESFKLGSWIRFLLCKLCLLSIGLVAIKI